jgi:hypothetical protein
MKLKVMHSGFFLFSISAMIIVLCAQNIATIAANSSSTTTDYGDLSSLVDGAIRMPFYPIGWSKDGKFAYLEEREEYQYGKTGIVFLNAVILDTVTDKVLINQKMSVKLNNSKNGMTQPESRNEGRNILSRQVSDKFAKLPEWDAFIQGLKDFKIELLNFDKIILFDNVPTLITPFPSRINNIDYTANIEQNDAGGNDGYNPKKRWTVFINSSKSGRKKIIERSDFASDISVTGYLPSPFGDRILVVITIEHKDSDRANSSRQVLSGCLLNTGFR